MRPFPLGVAALVVALLLAVAFPAAADEGHGHVEGPLGLDPQTFLWGGLSLAGVFAAILGSRWLLLRGALVEARTGRVTGGQVGGEVGYVAAIRLFSRNAKLFLGYSLLAELGTGIWAVLFNLYLLRVGFEVGFIGAFWLVNMLCHGAAALPAGLVADRYGRRRAFFIATGVSLVAQGSLLFTLDPTAILVLAGVAGFGEAFHGVTGAPFMMENSEPEERPHLFSLNSAFLQVSRFAGNLAGGVLPVAWALTLGLPALEPAAARWALVLGLPLTALALVPLAFMREKPVALVGSLRDLVTLRYVVNGASIARLTLLGLLTGAAFGLTIRFFNVFFQDVHAATDGQIGTILGLGAIGGAGAILIAPVLAQRVGKVRAIMATQLVSVPFLLAMAVVPSLAVVTAIYLTRSALATIALPLRNQLAMELVGPQERGTTAGFTHTSFDIGGGIGAGIAGIAITESGFLATFGVAAFLIVVPALLYFAWFGPLEARRGLAPTLAPAAAAGGK